MNEKHQKIKQELINSIENFDYAQSVDNEIQTLSQTQGINGVNNLQSFHKTWKSSKGKKGDKNAINSWLAYCIGMTSKKPDGPFLPFRKAFARAGFPDIDLDFQDNKRADVIKYTVQKYGRQNVANVGTYGTLKLKSAITRVGKALDIANAYHKGDDAYVTQNNNKVRQVLDTLPKDSIIKIYDEDGQQSQVKTIKDAYQNFDRFRDYLDKMPDLKQHSQNIQGLTSNFSCLQQNTSILTQNGYVRMKDLDQSDSVVFVDYNGKYNSTNKFKLVNTGVKSTYRMKLKSGQFIDITDQHPVLTDHGYVRFGQIRKDMKKYKIMTIKKDS